MPAARHFQNQASNEYYQRRIKRRVRLAAYLLGLALCLYVLLTYIDLLSPVNVRKLQRAIELDHVSPGERNLALVLPMDGPSLDLCKVIASAAALGYPTPIIVNWKKNSLHVNADANLHSHLLKITGVLDFLEWATNENTPEQDQLHEDDLVLMLDATDIWTQLAPEVLIQRYLAANGRANIRLADKFHGYGSSTPQQTIMVSAQKKCIAPRDTVSDLHCADMPESPLPDNLYGMWTDFRLSRMEHRRPRYVNSGSFLGPAGDMRKYFARVKARMDENLASPLTKQLEADQGLFGEIWAEQEIWRDSVLTGEIDIDDRVEEYEYHVGLDYFQELFYPTCGSEHSGSWVRLGDPGALSRASSEAGVTPVRVQKLPEDITTAKAPLQAFDDSTTSWDAVPLFTDFWTTSVPVGVHHNAFAHGLKGRRTTWWDKTWYFPHLRDLLEMRIASNSTGNIAQVSGGRGLLEVYPYQAEHQSDAALLFVKKNGEPQELRSADWDRVCQASDDFSRPWWEEVFRDDKGSLT